MSLARYLVFALPLVGCDILEKEPEDTGVETEPVNISARIEPAVPLSTDSLEVVVEGAEGELSYVWSVNGSPTGTADGATVDADLTEKEEIWSVVVTDSSSGGTATASVTILNSPPTMGGVIIEPGSPGSGDDLVAVVDATDPDADDLDYTFSWTVDGVAHASASDTIPATTTNQGEVWEVVVVASDGEYDTSEASATVSVANGAPEILSLTLSPEEAITTDPFVATSEVNEPDGEPVDLTYSWQIDGKVVQEGADDALDPSLTTKHDEVSVVLTASDGTTTSEAVSAGPVVVMNSLPTIAEVALSSESPMAAEPVSCTWSGYSDLDGDEDQSTVRWLVDGVEVSTEVEISEGYVRGQEISCEVTPFDGEESNAPIAVSAMVINSPPSVDTVEITPEPATSEDTLTCTYTGFVDADGDPDESEKRWTVNGSFVATGDTLGPDSFNTGDSVTCRVFPNDGIETGETMEATVSIDNTIPTVSDVEISPDPASALDGLTCTWTFSDADGDPDRSTVEWYVDGALVAGGPELPPANGVRGDLVECIVTPDDGITAGSPVTASITLDNAPPTVVDVAVEPDPAFTDSELSCVYTFLDLDEDPDESSVEWFVDGSSEGTGATLPAGTAVKGQTVECTVLPDDGLDTGDEVTASRVIENALPTLDEVVIEPEFPTASDTLTCTPVGFADADGDPDNTEITWRIGIAVVGTGDTLEPGAFGSGDTVVCSAVPNDGEEDGTPVNESVVIDNSAPSITSVSITPDPATSTDDLLCSWEGFSDPDGDADMSLVEWFIGGSPAGEGDILPAGGFVRGDEVECVVTPYDGALEGTPMSASIEIDNAAPRVVGVSVTPDPATTVDDLTCTYASYIDVDGDPDLSTLEWTVNDVVAGSSPVLSSSQFDKDDEVACTVTPNDGIDLGTALSATLIISNSPPTLTAAEITPDPATGNDSLSCDAVDFADADGDADQSMVSWRINGTPAGATPTLEGGFVDGDVVRCTLTAFDGTDTGDVANVSITIEDAPPVVDSATLLPDPLFTDAEAQLDASASDVDGDAVSLSYSWEVNGSPLAVTSSTLSGLLYFERDDVVTGTVTPSAGGLDGTAVSVSLTVANSLPPAPVVSFADTEPVSGEDDILCLVADGGTDADGDPIDYDIRWLRNGVLFGGTLESTTLTDDTVPADVHLPGESWTCIAAPDDGFDVGEPAQATVMSLDPYAGFPGGSTPLASATYELQGAGKAALGNADWDGDGMMDVALAEPGDNAVYVLTGADLAAGPTGTVDLATESSARLFASTGSPNLGRSLAAGDIDGDGGHDLAIGAPSATAAGGPNGRIYLLWAASVFTGDVTARADVEVLAESFGAGLASTGLGESIALGDVDGDSQADLLAGAPAYDDGTLANGAAYIFSGSDLATATVMASTASTVIAGGNASAGAQVAWAGDVDGDGVDDALIGDPDGGAAWLLYAASMTASMSFADSDHEFSNGPELGASVAGIEDLDGDGRSDLLLGDPSDSDVGTNAGAVFVVSSSSLLGAAYALPADVVAGTIVQGPTTGARLGYAMDADGDVDGDGLGDVLFGAPGVGGGVGTAYLWLGADVSASAGTLAVTMGDEQAFQGVLAGDSVGGRVSFAGDVNGDGLDDMLFPAYGDLADDALSAGASWLLLTPHN